MPKIALLPDALISQIAAGEVVERPASVVKELVENSIDAGATQCAIEVEQGGMKLIIVRDNGEGMSEEDAKMAFARHATSKIRNLDDLTNIRSFGFRGEALAAIASIAQVTLKTRPTDKESGTEITYKGGVLESINSIGHPVGTEIAVRNLFYSTPARRKFLKRESTELAHIVTTLHHMALAHPHVAFSLMHNGKNIFTIPAHSSELRLAAILGKNIREEMVPVIFDTPSFKINGYISKPGHALASKRHQYLMVNGREVTDSLINRAIIDAYGSRLAGRQFPMFVISLYIEPSEVDVNVHPRKLAVKFMDTQHVYRNTHQAIHQALGTFQDNFYTPPSTPSEEQSKTPSIQDALTFTENLLSQEKREEGIATPAAAILSQVADSYIVIHEEEGISLVDQHAAHERILYERLKAKKSSQESQPLLVPLTIETTHDETIFLKKALPLLTDMGFAFDEWSAGTFALQACPAELRKENLQTIFKNFLTDVMQEKSSTTILPEKILKSLACKAAVKFGMKLSTPEQQKLLQDLAQTQNNSTCPHGRPTKILLTFEELERRFMRRK